MSGRWELFMVRQEDPIGLEIVGEYMRNQDLRLLTGDFEGWQVNVVEKTTNDPVVIRNKEVLEKLASEFCPYVVTIKPTDGSYVTPGLYVGHCRNNSGQYTQSYSRLGGTAASINEVVELIRITNPLNGHWISDQEEVFVAQSLAVPSLIPETHNQVEWCKFAKAMAIIGGE
ncbi:hypothetical protein PP757_gp57 [Pseudomonas phage vB_PaeP_TUMS_P121]|uniref:Uncharacterized protein n=1 Tax=Pseudomonas phage vB_PaeP_TUMS_P121 TaxID=2873372 RepID=A0AAE8YFE8_9CAUD|nr:hypothetical protein PP757_gp57 [Pseudomonas phage vB_PaeP_TUMS_P121]UEP18689.1 hypothetical protein [Pseudomonas phage vB_PaeP_TUMS_P121]